jgi:hypothetical protein
MNELLLLAQPNTFNPAFASGVPIDVSILLNEVAPLNEATARAAEAEPSPKLEIAVQRAHVAHGPAPCKRMSQAHALQVIIGYNY